MLIYLGREGEMEGWRDGGMEGWMDGWVLGLPMIQAMEFDIMIFVMRVLCFFGGMCDFVRWFSDYEFRKIRDIQRNLLPPLSLLP